MLPALYKEAAVFIMPSFYEGFGLPLLEAMVYGTPVIGSNVSSIPEVVGDAGLLCDPADPRDIAAKMRFLIADKDEMQKYSQLGYLRVEKFSWKSMAEKTINVYKKCLA